MFYSSFLGIVFPVIVIIVLMRYGARISKLEQDMKKGAVVAPAVKTETVISAVSAQPAVASATSVGASKISVESEKPKVPSEENTGKILGKVGVFALFLGVAFFLKYAFDNNWIGETGRVMLGLVGGVVLIGIGQSLRSKYLQYSDLLMGGGIAILYLATYSAFGFYHLIPASIAFFLMAVITALALAVSVYNATQTLAIVAVFGGFITPTFMGSDTNNIYFLLLAYLTILNVGVLSISIFKKWRPLVFVGFIGTVINFYLSAERFYQDSMLSGTFLFLVVSFFIFIWATIAHNIRAKIKAETGDFGLLIVNAGLFALASYMLLDPEYHAFLGFGAVVLAVIYLLIANFANRFNPEDKALNFFLAGTGVVFLTLAVPLQFEGSWITTAWLVEALLVYATASFVQNRSFQVMGATVYVVGICRYFILDAFSIRTADFTPIFNKVFWLTILAIFVSYCIAYIYKRYGSTTIELGKRGIMVFVVAANILSVFTLTQQVSIYYDRQIYEAGEASRVEYKNCQQLNAGFNEGVIQCNTDYYGQNEITKNLKNTSNTLISILWAIYATILVVLGFARRLVSARNLGIILFTITAFKIFVDLWSLGELYRIISSIGFGIIALSASFLYAKYKDRLKQVV